METFITAVGGQNAAACPSFVSMEQSRCLQAYFTRFITLIGATLPDTPVLLGRQEKQMWYRLAALPVPHAFHWIRALSASVHAARPKKGNRISFCWLAGVLVATMGNTVKLGSQVASLPGQVSVRNMSDLQ